MDASTQIKEWLESDNQDFNQGIELFDKYSKNPSLKFFIRRKQDIERLKYQMRKLLGTNIKVVVKQTTVPVLEFKPKKIVAFEKIEVNTLTVEKKRLYDILADSYKTLRVFHEKMKLAKSDDERKEFRAECVKLDDLIAKTWKEFDEKTPALKKEGKKADDSLSVSRSINAIRTYISRSIIDIPKLPEKKKQTRIEETQKRVAQLIELKAPVSKETRKALIALAIIKSDSQLLTEIPIGVSKI